MSIKKEKMQEMQEQVLVMKEGLLEEEHKSLTPAEMPTETTVTEETVHRNAEVTVQMIAAAQQQLEPIVVNRTAEGQPAQPQQAPRFSSKKWKRDKQKAAIAKQHCEVGTAVTYDLVQQLQELTARQNTISDAYAAQCEAAHVDGRFLRGFCRGYKLNEQGQPLTEQDAENKRLDDAFAADYCSNELVRRMPHLTRMVQDVFSIKITADTLSEKNLREKAAELSRWADLSTYMQNVMNDPINQPYFEWMDQVKKTELTEKLDVLAKFSVTFSGKVAHHGVVLNGTYREGMTKEMQEDMDRNAAPVETLYQEARKALLQQEKTKEAEKKNLCKHEIFKKHEKALKKVLRLPREQIELAAMDYSKKMWLRGRELARLKEDPSLGLTETEKNGVYFSRGVMLLKDGAEHEAENLQMLRLLKELQPLGADRQPSVELYLRAKEAVAPRVNKVLDVDIEAWKKLSDAELISRMDELNELYMDGMFVADLMKLQHPYMVFKSDNKAMTLKQELLGQRQAEYAYKSTTLRALAERSRSLAILAKAQTNGRFELSDFTWTEQGKLNNGTEEFLSNRMELSEELMRTAKTKYENTFIPGTKEFKELLDYLVKNNGAAKLIMDDLRFNAVQEEFMKRETPELKKAMQRLKEKEYYTLNYSEGELEAMGLKKNIGEPIFRSFKSFLSMEAARTLLTPETYRQMLLDLGAGAGMHNGEWSDGQTVETVEENGKKITKKQKNMKPGTPQAELEDAMEKNNRGLQVYKQVISAQMDMVARKYGEGLEHLTIRDVLERHIELAADFDDGQTMMGMTTYHPDLCGMKEPAEKYFEAEHSAEDKLLMARVLYFNLAGKAINDVATAVRGGIMEASTNGIEQYFTECLKYSKTFAIAKKYLEENDPQFFHKVDWSQKVAAPAAEE